MEKIEKLPYQLTDTLLHVENVSLVFKNRIILRDVQIEVKDIVRPGMQQGQVIGFLGPSGYGKTQLFRILAGLQQPTTGTVRIGKDQKIVEQGDVGVVAQRYPLFRKRTVLDNLMIGAMQSRAKRSRPEANDAAMHMLERFKLADKASASPEQLSGGQQQRIAIAQQMLCDGKFLLMDEPFSGLDMRMKNQVMDLIHEIACMDEENTIIVVTHVISEAASVADTLWLLGRDRDTEGKEIPGSRIQQTYDLMDRGLAWRSDLCLSREFRDFTAEVEKRFLEL